MRFENWDDAVYAHTDYVKWLREHGEQVGSWWLEDRKQRYGNNAFVPSLMAWQSAMNDALNTDILWMSTEMMDLTWRAAETYDPLEPVTMNDIFIPNGFMVLPHAFYSRDANDKRLAWRCLSWQTEPHLITWPDEDAYTYNTQREGRAEGGVRFMLISHIDDEDDFYSKGLSEAMKVRGHHWGCAHASAIPFHFMSKPDELSGEGDRNASWLIFWRVAQKLMAQTIVTSERRQPGRAARREAERYRLPPPLLRVIELRRPRNAETGAHPSSRVYTHRWIVKGHWRNQWYPSRNDHRQKYIGEYVKGPEDLDLIVKRRIWNWDR